MDELLSYAQGKKHEHEVLCVRSCPQQREVMRSIDTSWCRPPKTHTPSDFSDSTRQVTVVYVGYVLRREQMCQKRGVKKVPLFWNLAPEKRAWKKNTYE